MKTLALVCLCIVMFIAGMQLPLLSYTTDNTDNSTWEEECTPQLMYTPPNFKINYAIDLKQDGYLIWDQQGNITKVEFNKLEDWFMRDNL